MLDALDLLILQLSLPGSGPASLSLERNLPQCSQKLFMALCRGFLASELICNDLISLCLQVAEVVEKGWN